MIEMKDKFEEHMCQPKTQEFVRANGEKDVFTFQPLGFEWMPKFFGLVRKMYGTMDMKDSKKLDKNEMSDEDIKKFMETMDTESWNMIKELIEGMMKESYPKEFETPEGKKKMSKFMAKNMMELLPILIEMNSPSTPAGMSPEKPTTFGVKDEPTRESTQP